MYRLPSRAVGDHARRPVPAFNSRSVHRSYTRVVTDLAQRRSGSTPGAQLDQVVAPRTGLPPVQGLLPAPTAHRPGERSDIGGLPSPGRRPGWGGPAAPAGHSRRTRGQCTAVMRAASGPGATAIRQHTGCPAGPGASSRAGHRRRSSRSPEASPPKRSAGRVSGEAVSIEWLVSHTHQRGT